MIVSSFKNSLKSLPFVFKKTSIYFGFYYLAFSALVLLLLRHSPQAFSPAITTLLTLLAHSFLVFIVPYYTYKQAKGPNIRPFWIFIQNSVWSLVLNYIKAFFILLFFFILLIIPGIYKSIRYFFIAQTVFFDELYKREGLSPLKGSDKTSRGHFWRVFGFTILLSILSFLITVPLLIIKPFLPIPTVGVQFITLVLGFYVACFNHIAVTHFYFELKKAKGEAVSC